MSEPIVISFPEVSTDKGGAFAEGLRKDLKRIAPALPVERQREHNDAQDFGATLVAVVTSAAVTALAKGISNFITKRGTKIRVKIGDTYIDATGVESRDAAEMVKALEKQSKH